ncbi:MAG TPA: glutamine--fructose-6-phosphate transaminase (isomerizing) [Dehalococcoidia bacterium]|nr:glutamine--fructose-6-phosphate transaminase (isomerizing) [Dehalococcoidia bacterium]
MCGIIGYVGHRPAAPILLEGLERLEYRGYDSAGIAVLDADGCLRIDKSVGKLRALTEALSGHWSQGLIGIGHTRWATHGRPSYDNAHPLADCRGELVAIHNGILENYRPLKERLQKQGHHFRSDTDTEVIVHLVEERMRQGDDLTAAVAAALRELEGSHALVFLSCQEPDRLVTARLGHAGGIVVGHGDGEMLVASDLPAILPHAQRVDFLQDQELAVVTAEGVRYLSLDGTPLRKEPQAVPYDPVTIAKGPYKHFMVKEVSEQPEAITDTVRSCAHPSPPQVFLDDVPWGEETVRGLERAVLIGMGTSYHAAMLGRLYLEQLAGLPAEADNSSEFRYREPLIGPNTLLIAMSQSGETVDTLAAMQEGRRRGARLLAVCNVTGSQATRLAEGTVYTRCGPELGVASTKTFTAAVAALYLLALWLGQRRGVIDEERLAALLEPLARLPHQIGLLLEHEENYAHLAHLFYRQRNFLYLGRGVGFPVAMEGALKLKEVAYIHAEGYPAGEMKHGPIALIDPEMPVVTIALRDGLREKMLANIEELKAREGTIIALLNQGDGELAAKADHALFIPETHPLLSPILAVVPLQLLAYHIALRRGCDVDQHRNLAKTVTVE